MHGKVLLGSESLSERATSNGRPFYWSRLIMFKTLEEVVAYKHPAVVRRYIRDVPANADKAEQIFEDLMRFFWASKKHSIDRKNNPNDEALDFTFIMDEDMRDIDQMWHVFLLYTQDYMSFCDEYFGEYLHHLPDVVQNTPSLVTHFESNLEKFLNYVYDALGEPVILRWFPS